MTAIAASTTYSELEIKAEIPLETTITTVMSITDSATAMIERVVGATFIPIKTKKGKDAQVHVKDICNKRNVNGFLVKRGLDGLLRLSWIAERSLHQEYRKYLRAREKGTSNYAMVADSDIELMDTMCLYAIARRVVWNKREKNAFVDTSAAMKAETAYLLENQRGSVFGGLEHIAKHRLSPEEAAAHMKSIHEQRRGQVLPMISEASNG